MKKTFIKSMGYAIGGIMNTVKEEPHVRFDLCMTVLVVFCAFFFPLEKWEQCTVFILCALCIAFEIVNSAIERTVDLASPDIHPLAGKAKDMAAGAVLVVAAISSIIGLYIFVPYGIDFIQSFI